MENEALWDEWCGRRTAYSFALHQQQVTYKHCVFDVTWSVEQNRGTNILSVDTGAVFQVLFIKLNAEHF